MYLVRKISLRKNILSISVEAIRSSNMIHLLSRNIIRFFLVQIIRLLGTDTAI